MGAEEEEPAAAVGRGGRAAGAGAGTEGDGADSGEGAGAVVPCSICLGAVVAGGGDKSTVAVDIALVHSENFHFCLNTIVLGLLLL
uniref:Uncharacterized protein n=1 Tax=Oryza barthii TaxID=65489 RepID=A0A0D3GUC0_9ORYZ